MRGLSREINHYLEQLTDIEQFEVAGSFRRFKEESKDLDYIISTTNPDSVQQQLLEIPNKVKEVAVGQTKISLELTYDDETIGVDFRLIEPAAFIIRCSISLGLKITTSAFVNSLKKETRRLANMVLRQHLAN